MRLPNLYAMRGKLTFLAGIILMGSPAIRAQEAPQAAPQAQAKSSGDRVGDLQEQMTELKSMLEEMRGEMIRSRKEALELRHELEATRQELAAASQTKALSGAGERALAGPAQQAPASQANEEALRKSEEDRQLTNAKLEDLYQTKVESASKYRVRFSGIALLNLFTNRGKVDNQDVPSFAVAPVAFDARGNFGGTLRQSEIGFEVFGPHLGGARTMADLQFDLGGGFPNTANGVNSGLLRLRTGTMRLDWSHTSVVAGQDNVFFSPLSPTSFASLIVPAFAYAGNLWAWVPQVRVEHRFDISEKSGVTLQAGILDNLTGELPPFQSNRVPQAGERSSQPGYALRTAWTGSAFGQPITFGIGGYYSRQDWAFSRHVDGWAGTADWSVPLTRWFSLSGEFYRGLAVGGLGGGVGRSVVFSSLPTDPTGHVRGVDSMGGWSQLKFKPTSRWEFNGAFGLDNAQAEDLRAFGTSLRGSDSYPARNRSSFINFIYRPYSNLLFSTEYRHLRAFQINGDSYAADQVNLMMGVLF